MKTLLLLMLMASLVACTTTSKQPGPAPEETFKVFRGTNIAHWLSQSRQCGEAREQFFTQADMEAIASMGFDHVRIPIDEEQMWDEEGNRHPEAFQLMHNGIEWAREAGLRVIIDLHILRSHYFNAEVKPLWTEPAEQEKFCDLWRDLSAALHLYPNDLVAYELLNEAVAEDPESWNSLVARAVAAIREREPTRTLVIGSNRFQSASTFDVLKIPDNDPFILLSFHFYGPFLLTHYQASWTFLRDYTGPVHYPGVILTEEEFNQLPEAEQAIVKNNVGQAYDKAWIRQQWELPIRKAREWGLPLYCGEFGVITGTPEADRLLWYQDMIDLFEETGIGYANWNYKSDNFGLLRSDGSRHEALIHIVSGK